MTIEEARKKAKQIFLDKAKELKQSKPHVANSYEYLAEIVDSGIADEGETIKNILKDK